MNAETETEFTFAELSKSIQFEVLDRHRYDDVEDQWWDAVYEDAVTIGKLIGIEVGVRHRGYGIDISFSGFCSQGDGCCYSGWLNVGQLKGCVARLREHTGTECEDDDLFKLAAEGEALYASIAARLMALRLSGEWDGSHAYFPDGEISPKGGVTIVGDDRYWRTNTSAELCSSDIEELVDSYVSGFADWIYKQLEAESDYLTSDEAIIERLAEIKFDEDGSEV